MKLKPFKSHLALVICLLAAMLPVKTEAQFPVEETPPPAMKSLKDADASLEAKDIEKSDSASSSSSASFATPKTDLIQVELSMAENGYDINPSDDNKNVLVTAYEKAIAHYCMPTIHNTLEYSEKPSNPECALYIQKLLKLDPDNAVAICADKGIDSQSCLRAFQLQSIATFVGGQAKGSAAAIELEATVKIARNQKQIDSLQNEANLATQKWNQEQSEANLNRLREVYANFIRASCVISMTKLAAISPGERARLLEMKPTPTPVPQGSLADAIIQMQNEIQRRNEASSAAQGQVAQNRIDDIFALKTAEKRAAEAKSGKTVYYKRVRYITLPCKNASEQILKLLPSFPSATCQLYGLVSPQCIADLRKAKLEASVKAAQSSSKAAEAASRSAVTRPRQQDGLSSF